MSVMAECMELGSLLLAVQTKSQTISPVINMEGKNLSIYSIDRLQHKNCFQYGRLQLKKYIFYNACPHGITRNNSWINTEDGHCCTSSLIKRLLIIIQIAEIILNSTQYAAQWRKLKRRATKQKWRASKQRVLFENRPALYFCNCIFITAHKMYNFVFRIQDTV